MYSRQIWINLFYALSLVVEITEYERSCGKAWNVYLVTYYPLSRYLIINNLENGFLKYLSPIFSTWKILEMKLVDQ